MPTLLQDVEAFFNKAEAAIEAELEADWAVLKPAIVALGKSVEAEVLQAAQTLVSTGGNFPAALASITSQLPADAVAIETAVAGLLAAKIAGLKAAPPAA